MPAAPSSEGMPGKLYAYSQPPLPHQPAPKKQRKNAKVGTGGPFGCLGLVTWRAACCGHVMHIHAVLGCFSHSLFPMNGPAMLGCPWRGGRGYHLTILLQPLAANAQSDELGCQSLSCYCCLPAALNGLP